MIDLFPRDRESACFADMTRTFVIGEPSDELREWHRLCKEALDNALGDIRAGVTGKSVYDGTCDDLRGRGLQDASARRSRACRSRRGSSTRSATASGSRCTRSRRSGCSAQELVAGDVVSVEPGLYKPGVGGCRLEDLVLVTEGGCENLTDYPYDLEP